MRIVAGSARGRRIEAPTGRATRPTGDAVREAIFNVLFGFDAVVGAEVYDLFAGSGALGLEALSRGAERVTFVESDRAAAAVIERNITTLGFAHGATVVRRRVEDFLATGPAVPVDLVLADPPYAYDGWDQLLGRLEGHLADDAVAVLESDREVDLPTGWEKRRVRTYGGTVVTFARGPQASTQSSGAQPPPV